MGILSRLKPKEEHYHVERNGETRVVKVEPEPVRSEVKELTREEQFEQRKHPWKTERGKKVISGLKTGAKRIDSAIVTYNRKYNPARPNYKMPRQSASSYGITGNYNPFGSMFDTGMGYKKPKKKSSSKKQYAIVGGKAYEIAGTGKRKQSKSSRRRKSGFDVMDNWGFM